MKDKREGFKEDESLKEWLRRMLTTNMRRLLHKALQTHYYNKYHPIRALRDLCLFYGFNRGRCILVMSSIDHDVVYFSHLIDMQTLLCPGFADGVLIKKMIDSIEFDEDDNSQNRNSELSF